MGDTNSNWSNLIDKYLRKEITPEEKEELQRQLIQHPLKQDQFSRHTDKEKTLQRMREYYNLDLKAGLQKSKLEHPSVAFDAERRRNHSKWYKVAAITIGIILLSAISYFLLRKNSHQLVKNNFKKAQTTVLQNEEAKFPTLQLNDGRKIVLSPKEKPDTIFASNISIIYESGIVRIETIDNSHHNLETIDNSHTFSNFSNNILSTPPGYHVALRLIDKSYIELNNASSIKFPLIFPEKERRLEIEGEAYFQITKNSKKPCIVKTNRSLEVLVFGTTFNVSSYPNEQFTATLIRGKIKIDKGNKKYDLMPGQQARLFNNEIVVNTANIPSVTAWTKYELDLYHKNIKEVLNEVGRQFNKEVLFNGSFSDSTFDTKIPFSLGLPRIIQALSELNHIEIIDSGKNLIAIASNNVNQGKNAITN